MGYVSFNTGFKSGGFNANQYADAPYQPETIDAWELGMKSSLLDDRLRLNVAGFFYVYDDIQFGRFENGTTFFYNAAEAEIRGMEVDFEALVTESLSFTGGLSLLDTEFTESSDNIVNHRPNHVFGGNDETRESVKGNDLPKAPDLTLSLAAQYFVSLGSGDLTLSALYSYNDGYFANPDNIVGEDNYSMLNLSAMYQLHSGLQFTLWAKNVTDEFVSQAQYSSQVVYAEAYLPPRTYGITAKYAF